jgi:hypothetical protein
MVVVAVEVVGISRTRWQTGYTVTGGSTSGLWGRCIREIIGRIMLGLWHGCWRRGQPTDVLLVVHTRRAVHGVG